MDYNSLNILNRGQNGYGILVENEGFIDVNADKNEKLLKEIAESYKDTTNNKAIVPYPFIVYAVLQKADVENKNGRYYPYEVLYREYEKYLKLIKERRAVGESNHPDTSVIATDKIAHNITEMFWEKRTLIGAIEILMSPGFINMGIISCQGDIIANLLRQRILLGVSSRGVGSLKEIRGKNYVQEDFELICWDDVVSPSTPGSWIFQNKEQAFKLSEAEIKNKGLLIDKLDRFILN